MMDPSSALSAGIPKGSRAVQATVPREHESVLSRPLRDQWQVLAESNSKALSTFEIDLQGMTLQTLRQIARTSALRDAVNYTQSLIGADVAPVQPGLIFVTGHQPELFHAGVWAKNFAIAGVSRTCAGTPLNLIIDNDTVSSTQIRIPAGSAAAPKLDWIQFDGARPEEPWEESRIVDMACFTSFGQRMDSQVRSTWHYDPIISECWPAAVRQAGASPQLRDCLAAARVSAERVMGLRNLELPMSQICSSFPFCWFAAYVMAHLQQFHRFYNQSIRAYRQVHRLRSSTHPVPELQQDDEWLEAPFWIWRAGSSRRERPFLRYVGEDLELRDRRGWSTLLPISSNRTLDAGAAALSDLPRQGIRVRTRALTTTLFARLCLADLFVHGIGGAKYDLMTNSICRDFFGIDAPDFATLSATVHLPLSAPYPVGEHELREMRQRIRDCRYNPDRWLPACIDISAQQRVAQKQRLLASIAGRRPSSNEHQQLAEINRQLFPLAAPQQRNLLSEIEILQRQVSANTIFQDREFSWCLHPEQQIRAFMEREFL